MSLILNEFEIKLLIVETLYGSRCTQTDFVAIWRRYFKLINGAAVQRIISWFAANKMKSLIEKLEKCFSVFIKES